MKYQAVKSFNALKLGSKGKWIWAVFLRPYLIQNTPEGHLWARRKW